MHKNKNISNRFVFHKAPFKAAEYFDFDVDVQENGTAVSMIPVFPIGKFEKHHDIPEGFEITNDTIQGFVDTFDSGVQGDELPVYAGHGNGFEDRPAVGWVKSLINRGDKGLWAMVEWTEEGVRLIRSKAFKFISPEWLFDYEDPRTMQKIKNILFAPALVNEPYFQMPAVTASKKNNITIITSSMNIKELLAKSADELTEEEKTYLREYEGELTEEEKTKVSELTKEEEKEEGKEDEKQEESKEGAEDAEGKEDDAAGEDGGEGSEEEEKAEEAGAESDDDAAGSDDEEEQGKEEVEDDKSGEGSDEGTQEDGGQEEGKATASKARGEYISASELSRLRASDAELKKTKITASVKKAGVVPSQQDSVVDFALKVEQKMGEEAGKEFVDIVSKAKAGLNTKRVTSSEKKGETVEYETAQDELEKRAEAHAEKEGVTLDKAITEIANQDPKLMSRVDEERAQ